MQVTVEEGKLFYRLFSALLGYVNRRLVVIPEQFSDSSEYTLLPPQTRGLEVILTQTHIAKTKELRPRLEMMAAQGTSVDLDINDWSRILLALCGTRSKEVSFPKH